LPTRFPNWREIGSILREPVPAEMSALLEARRSELPADLRTGWQVVGRHLSHCGFTLGPSYCSFGCTHCYLPENANRVPIPPLEEMKQQIDANRRMIGPGGGLQITGGDVVDAYWRAGRADELVTVIRHATDAGVIPMLMTHGQILLENPGYLERLVRDGGLRKIAVHIDITQAGRPGFPLLDLRTESDLHPLREAFADLILDVRRRTGITFFAAHTVTVCERNLDSIGEILQWMIAKPHRLDAFRMISLQTEADVGRTRFSTAPATPEETWKRIETAVGIGLPADNLWFGHPDCSRMTTLLVIYPERRVVNLIPADSDSRAFWSALLEVFGGVGGRGESFAASLLRKASAAARRPAILPIAMRYLLRRLRRERLGAGAIARILSGRFRGLNIVMHNFMNASELREPLSETANRRLGACAFRGAVRRNGTWEAVPMCRMNAGLRESLYSESQDVQPAPRRFSSH
jgi:hypothetical protein